MAVKELAPERKLTIATNLEMDPVAAASQRMVWVGASGSGKSYGCGRYVEQAHAAQIPMVIVDTVGIWPALRLAHNGKSPGLPFVVIGGDHADVPLDLASGGKLATFLITSNASAVIDLSDYDPDERAPFVAVLCERTLALIKAERRPRTFIFDEAQDIAPQKPSKGEARMLRAVSALIRKGRNHLCGTILLTQRPQDVSKSCLNIAGNMFVGALFAKHERAAVQDWAGSRARSPEVEKQIEDLPSLQPGEFFFWSPSWLQRYDRIKVLPKWTFDGSSTTPLDSSASLEKLAPVDVEALKALFAKDPEPDPEPEKASKQSAKKVDPVLAESRALQEQLSEARDEIASLNTRLASFDEAVLELETSVRGCFTSFRDRRATVTLGEPPPPKPAPLRKTKPPPAPAPEHAEPAVVELEVSGNTLSKPQRLILGTLKHRGAMSLRRLAISCGYRYTGGGFRNLLGGLRTLKFIAGTDPINITTAAPLSGLPKPIAASPLYDLWSKRFGLAARTILGEMIAHASDKSITLQKLADLTCYEVSGGGFRNAVGAVRSAGIIVGKGELQLSEDACDFL